MLSYASLSSPSDSPAMTVGIAYVDGPRLARAVYAAADWVAAGRDEINRINVFPVPDGDTGTNFSLTLRAVADALRSLGDAPLPATARAAGRAAVQLYDSLDDPREGTILTGAREAAAAAERASLETADISEFMRIMLREGE